jgi:hypothetical protein
LLFCPGCLRQPARSHINRNPTAVPTAVSTPTPTLAQTAETLKAQLIADKVLVRTIESDDGALPTLTVVYDLDTTL